MKNIKLNYIDIFAGCGGLSLGFYKTNRWQGLFAIEKNSDAFLTLRSNLIDRANHFNWPEWLPQQEHDINLILKNHKNELKLLRNKVDLVAGGPPCQGFSVAGKRQEGDERNSLIKSYVKFIRITQPKIIFFE
ncbi:MAG: DNA cytosine methyltransferase, partial [Chloroflexi bacterium]|nr:DNA cytosine methyltransferase [Chloroflexota bacterium]